MALDQPYLDVPGTTIFDAEQSRKGYGLNQFCMSLMKAENRSRFKANERAYLIFNCTSVVNDAITNPGNVRSGGKDTFVGNGAVVGNNTVFNRNGASRCNSNCTVIDKSGSNTNIKVLSTGNCQCLAR